MIFVIWDPQVEPLTLRRQDSRQTRTIQFRRNCHNLGCVIIKRRENIKCRNGEKIDTKEISLTNTFKCFLCVFGAGVLNASALYAIRERKTLCKQGREYIRKICKSGRRYSECFKLQTYIYIRMFLIIQADMWKYIFHICSPRLKL